MLKPIKPKAPKLHKVLYIDDNFYVKINKTLYLIDLSKYKLPNPLVVYAYPNNNKQLEWISKSIEHKHVNKKVLKYWSLLRPNLKIKGAVLNDKFYLTWKEH